MVGIPVHTSLAIVLFTHSFRNPTLEEQALARIHRIGQKQSVTTVRFYIRDSFEEVSTIFSASNEIHYSYLQIQQQVMELQESKKSLAGVLLSPHDGGHTDDSLGTLQVRF